MNGLQQEDWGDEPVVRNREVEPAGESGAPRLGVLEHGVYVPGDAGSQADVAVVAKPLELAVGPAGGVAYLGDAARALELVELP
jgi:hypothetical protein